MLITTYKRAALLALVLSALKKQTCKAFDVLAVVKPSGDGTEDVIRQYKHSLNIKMLIQSSGNIIDAIKTGLKHATGEIIAFIDDDAVPSSDWIQRQLEDFELPEVGGLAGDVITASLDELYFATSKNSSEIIPAFDSFNRSLGRKLWGCPLEGLEDYLVYVTKAGMVDYNLDLADQAQYQNTKTLLGMGANMSILAKAATDLQFPDSWVLGLSYEQFIAWHIWKKGYKIMFNPNNKVYHVKHGQTLSRNITDKKRNTLRQTEDRLLFYRLYGIERKLSKMHRLIWLVFDLTRDIKKICINRESFRIWSLKSKTYSEIIGIKWLLSRKFGGNYTPIMDLERILAD